MEHFDALPFSVRAGNNLLPDSLSIQGCLQARLGMDSSGACMVVAGSERCSLFTEQGQAVLMGKL